MSQTEKNVQAAFAGESQANRKYLAFAKKADQDGNHPGNDSEAIWRGGDHAPGAGNPPPG